MASSASRSGRTRVRPRAIAVIAALFCVLLGPNQAEAEWIDYGDLTGHAIFCPPALIVSLPYNGDLLFGSATKTYSTAFYTTYDYTAVGAMWMVGGLAIFSSLDCIIMATTGTAHTLDYTVDWFVYVGGV